MTSSREASVRAIRRLLFLLDLSRDLERHQDDLKFSASGEIIYVFDENIFEAAVRPHRHHGSAEAFYADLWRPRGAKENLGDWRAFECQAALVAAETLFAGGLPGSRDDRIFLTDPHRYELARRVNELAARSREQFRNLEPGKSDQLLRKLQILAEVSEQSSSQATRLLIRVDKDTQDLHADVDALRRKGIPENVLNRFRLARVVAEALAADELHEPLEQLRRLTSAPMRDRIAGLNSLYPVRPGEKGQLLKAAEDWYDWLRHELSLPQHRKRNRDPRAVWNDAQALAQVVWAAARADRDNKRLVMVTGDPILFDAYRRRHAAAPRTAAHFFEPFVLRRLRQYAPLINLRHAQGGAGEDQVVSLLGLVQESFEASLVGLSISNMAQDRRLGGTERLADVSIARARERLALKLSSEALYGDAELAPLKAQLGTAWLRESEAELRSLRERWQEVERATLGLSYDVLEQRLTAEKIRLARAVTDKGGSAESILQDYLQSLLDEVVVEGLKLWLPLAADVVASRGPLRGAERPRAPLAFDLRLPDGTLLVDAVEEWWDTRGAPTPPRLLAPRTHAALAQDPAMVFAVAAVIALAVQEPNEAERFAGLAVQAAEADRGGRENQRHAHLIEFTFLHAVAARFQMAAISGVVADRPGRTAAEFRYVLRANRKARNALARHEALLAESAPDTLNDPDAAILRRIRAQSERSGLCLFLAAHVVAWGGGRSPRTTALKATAEAKAAILSSFELERQLSTADYPLLARLRRQFIPNMAATEALRSLLEEEYRFDTAFNPYIKTLKSVIDGIEGAQPLLRAEYLAFLCLADRAPRDVRAQFAKLRQQASRAVRLPLDHRLLEVILSHFA